MANPTERQPRPTATERLSAAAGSVRQFFTTHPKVERAAIHVGVAAISAPILAGALVAKGAEKAAPIAAAAGARFVQFGKHTFQALKKGRAIAENYPRTAKAAQRAGQAAAACLGLYTGQLGLAAQAAIALEAAPTVAKAADVVADVAAPIAAAAMDAGKGVVQAAVEFAKKTDFAQAIPKVAETVGGLAKDAIQVATKNPFESAAAAAGFIVGGPVGAAVAAGAAAQVPVEHRPAALQSEATSPTSTAADFEQDLEKIAYDANNLLEGARNLGITPKDSTGQIHKERIKVKPKVGTVLPGETVEALGPLERAAETDWKEKQDLKPLWNQAAIASTLKVMRDWAGNDTLPQWRILQIAGHVQSGAKTDSIWTIFNAELKNLTLFQKIKAGLAYLIFYQSGLMHKIMRTMIEHHYKKFTQAIHAQSDANRLELFHALLEHGNQFLAGEARAAQNYVNGFQHPNLKDQDLDAHRRWVVENRYGFDLTKLCRNASASVIDKGSPVIPFFESLHSIWIVGYISKALESAINYLIKNRLKNAILPQALQATVEKSAELTEPHQLRFAIKATEFLTELLEKFRREIPDLGKEANPLAVSPVEQGQVRNFAKSLITFLNLKRVEQDQPNEGLMGAVKNVFNGQIDDKLEEVMEVALFQGVNKLFFHFNEKSQSQEFSARLLSLADELFKLEELDPVKLRERYHEVQSRLNDVSAGLVSEVVDMSFKQLTNPELQPNPHETAEKLFLQTQSITRTTLEALQGISDKLPAKVAEKSDIQADLADLAMTMKVFSTSSDMRINMRGIQHKEKVWAVFTPHYQTMKGIGEEALKLQKAQGKYTSHTRLVGALENMKALLEKIDSEMGEDSATQLVQSLALPTEIILKALDQKKTEVAEQSGRVTQLVEKVRVDTSTVQEEQKRMAAADQMEALLPDWEKFEQGYRVSKMFQPGKRGWFLSSARAHLAHFPEEKRKQIDDLIEDRKFPAARRLVQQVHEEAKTKQDALKAALKAYIKESLAWATAQGTYFQGKSEQNDREMKTLSASVAAGIRKLKQEVEKAKLPTDEKSFVRRGGERIKVGLLSYEPIGATVQGRVAAKINQLAETARRLIADRVIHQAVVTRALSAMAAK